MNYRNEISDGELQKGLKRFLKTAPDIYMPGLSVDTVIFGFHDNNLNVLLLRLGNLPYFFLPGGHIRKEEHLDDAALRILQERTGLKNIYLEQFYTSGNSNRLNGAVGMHLLRKAAGPLPPNNWLEQRFVSVCYYALIDDTKVHPQTELFITEFKWFDIREIPDLPYDHNAIIQKALARLQADLDSKLVGFNLLSETFTMGQLQKLYETVHQKKFIRSNFQRKMLSLNVLERLEKQYNGKAHKAPYLYRFAQT